MIPLPNQPAAKASILDWATQAQRTLRALRPISGLGIRINETPNGIVISANCGTGSSNPGQTTRHPFQILDATQTDPENPAVKTPYLGVYIGLLQYGLPAPLGYSFWDLKTDYTGDPDGLLEVPAIGGRLLIEIDLDIDLNPTATRFVSDPDGQMPLTTTQTQTINVLGADIDISYINKQRYVLAEIIAATEPESGLILTIGTEQRKIRQLWKTDKSFTMNVADGYPTLTPYSFQ